MSGYFRNLALACWFAAIIACCTAPAFGQAKAEGSSPEAILAYREAANLQNNNAFDVAAEEWQKFLKDFPKDPLAAKAQHYLGVCQLQNKQPAKAADSFAAVIKEHPEFELLEDALLNLGSAQFAQAQAGKNELYVSAAATFTTLL